MANVGIYTGFWRDYSASAVSAGVLTLPISSAGYLISSLTLLVTLASTMFWVILTYIWHQLKVPPRTPMDQLDLQRQVLLRNVNTPALAILHVAKLYLAQRKTANNPLSRLLPIAVAAGFVIVLFLAAGVFVAAIASQSEDDILVLAKPGVCGEVTSNYSDGSSSDIASAAYAWTTSKALRGREYAKLWYTDNTSLITKGSSAFPVRKLPYTTSRVPCPFSGIPTRCRFTMDNTSDANTAIAFDTGLLNSALHLGINGPIERSLQFRRRTTCMPFKGTGLSDPFYVEDGQNFTALLAGPYRGPGNITLKYNQHLAEERIGYLTG
jgi:hypothetical protein